LYDAARDVLPGSIELDDTSWRTEYLYSRAATIYGGTAEVQRNIIARRLLDLGKE
jgi:alkylation response protein AidB-like acyl-CoA dehydrogenase